jgi:hypothetical protein
VVIATDAVPRMLLTVQVSDIGRQVHCSGGAEPIAARRMQAQALRRAEEHMSISPPAMYEACSIHVAPDPRSALQAPGMHESVDGHALQDGVPGRHPEWPALLALTVHAVPPQHGASQSVLVADGGEPPLVAFGRSSPSLDDTSGAGGCRRRWHAVKTITESKTIAELRKFMLQPVPQQPNARSHGGA